jgi:hypothetical protein
LQEYSVVDGPHGMHIDGGTQLSPKAHWRKLYDTYDRRIHGDVLLTAPQSTARPPPGLGGGMLTDTPCTASCVALTETTSLRVNDAVRLGWQRSIVASNANCVKERADSQPPANTMSNGVSKARYSRYARKSTENAAGIDHARSAAVWSATLGAAPRNTLWLLCPAKCESANQPPSSLLLWMRAHSGSARNAVGSETPLVASASTSSSTAVVFSTFAVASEVFHVRSGPLHTPVPPSANANDFALAHEPITVMLKAAPASGIEGESVKAGGGADLVARRVLLGAVDSNSTPVVRPNVQLAAAADAPR